MNAPVILFVYNRLEHTINTIEALKKNHLSNETNLIIFSDGFKYDTNKSEVDAVRAYCKEIDGFKDIQLIVRDENFGLAKNIIEGVSQCFQTYEKLIVLEDDLITTEFFLTYMNNALDYYKDSSAFVVSGYLPPIKLSEEYAYSTICLPRNCSWGWATWRDRWESVNWEVPDFDGFITSKKKRLDFELGGNDLCMMLLKERLGKINSWSIRFNYAMFMAKSYCVYPVRSFILNNGADGSGTHMRKSSKYVSELNHEEQHLPFCADEFTNHTIQTAFKAFYDTSLVRRLINFFKLRFYLFFKKE